MPFVDNSSISCGVLQLYGLSASPKTSVYELAWDIVEELNWKSLPAFVIFSDNTDRDRGRKLAAYINSHKLGKVYATQPKLNDSSGFKIQVWTWSIDWPAIVRSTKVDLENIRA